MSKSPLIPDDEPVASGNSQSDAVIDRILRRGAKAQALGTEDTHSHSDSDGDQLELEERTALRRVAGLSTELEDVSEVEYRKLRLEQVVLIGLWGEQSLQEAENSLRELAALAETAGATVLDGLLQRRTHPDPATYLGKGKAQELRQLVAATGADVVVTDTWVSMGQEDQKAQRVADFAGYEVDASIMANADAEAIFMHCLPAYRGYEVSAEVLDGPQSVIWDEAENRLHAQKALMAWLAEQA